MRTYFYKLCIWVLDGVSKVLGCMRKLNRWVIEKTGKYI